VCRVKKLVVMAVLLATCAVRAQPPRASTLVVEGLGKGTVLLDGPWQFHLGDDMDWANPALDDSHWEQLSAGKPWGAQGHPNNGGYGWYRRHISISSADEGTARSTPPSFAVFFPAVQDAYEVYWNGALVGGFGKLPPHPHFYNFSHRGLPAMPFNLGVPQSGVLAVRVWKAPPVTDGTPFQGGFIAAPVFGEIDAVERYKISLDFEWLRNAQFAFALNSLYALAALLAFLAWLRDRNQALLLWTTGYCIAHPVLFLALFARLAITRDVQLMIFAPATGIRDISLWFLLLLLLHLDENQALARWVRRLAWTQCVLTTLDGPACAITLSGAPGWSPLAQRLDVLLTVAYTTLEMLPLALILYAIVRRRRLDPARWLVAALAFLTEMIEVAYIAAEQGRAYTRSILSEKIDTPLFTVFGSGVNLQTLANTLLLLSIIYAMYRYTADERRRQETLQQEVKNARAVQQVLIPETIPHVPGFVIGSFYKPAGEVGGDFFQILATRDGGVLAVIGDVSGKGMPAAMTVSLLVGTVRTLAHYTQSPGEILDAMNLRMLGRSQGGFTTCLVLRVDANGALTMANAGHIAPYLASEELALENGLPLGLAAQATYPESTFQLAKGEQLTLLTDGVVEAREKDGTLFGFDRTAAISTQSAEAIAQAAQDFGQDDDITVLTLTLTAAEAAHA
jgi:serine phosphatase RsbU (regulator of sigma subunit)